MKKRTLFFIVYCLFFQTVVYSATLNRTLWNFDNADIQAVIKRVSEETGKNFIIDPRVQGKVTIVSQTPLNSDEIYQVFLSTLRVHGFKALDMKNAIKIVPQDTANGDLSTILQKGLQPIDQPIIKIIKLKYVTAEDAYNLLRGTIPKTSYITPVEVSNQLIVADTENNIRQLEKILSEVDIPMARAMDVITLEYASATELVNVLSNLLREKPGAKAYPISLGSDERTNSILLSGGSKELQSYVHKVVKQLDKPSGNGEASEVIYLKYAQASNIAPIVATFLQEALRTSIEPKFRLTGAENDVSMITSGKTFQNNNQNFPENHLRALRENAQNAGMQGTLFTQNEQRPQSGIINRFVQWEESTNAIIVKAPPTIMRSIKSIIAKLDIRRPQVIIEVIIAEVALDRLENYGVEWDVSPNAAIKFGTRFFSQDGIVGNFSGGEVSQLDQGLSVGIFRHGNLRALVKMLSSDTSANILSTPTLVTLDNQTALIKVGQKVPFAIGQTNNQNVGGNPFTSYDREEVGLSLTIKPQIVNTNEIKLQIENILSNIIPNSANQNTGGNPTTSERIINTNVLVHEDKILVLGGLIQDSWQEVKKKVPFLGSMPWLGTFFGYKQKELVKSNLIIFLRPRIIHNDTNGVRISTSKYEKMRESQLESYSILEHPFVDEPITSPPLKNEDYFASSKEQHCLNQYSMLILPNPFD